ncbi:hypothetical protein BDP27DRAFT_1380457 [Rhodocollybia butyracea]|uniref:Uncharacterized protein n=1 Tax=Rhodocollybia butyracea TaxID=206335 RepID=A0A9P5UD33_9AGAR|nr:hypothetical protein BDP27DRAFT_1380457 [Rhodocollybia butyracea]
MTVRFTNYRIAFYGTVLGIAAHFAAIFLPGLHQAFTIFAIVVPSLTIFILMLIFQWSQPRIEAVVLFAAWAIWLAMGAWAGDIIGFVQCDSLTGQGTAAKHNGTTSFQAYCYEMKVIQAFSWMIFALCTFAFIILLQLVTQAQRFGRWAIWREPIRELGWYGEMPGYYNTTTQPMVQYPQYGYGAPYGYSSGGVQQPGQSIVIQPSMNGGPPTVTQIPV